MAPGRRSVPGLSHRSRPPSDGGAMSGERPYRVVLVAGTRQHTEALREQVAADLAILGLRL